MNPLQVVLKMYQNDAKYFVVIKYFLALPLRALI